MQNDIQVNGLYHVSPNSMRHSIHSLETGIGHTYVRMYMYVHIYIHKAMVAIWTDKTEIKPCGARNYSTQCLPLCYCTEKAKLLKPTDVALSLLATVQLDTSVSCTYLYHRHYSD